MLMKAGVMHTLHIPKLVQCQEGLRFEVLKVGQEGLQSVSRAPLLVKAQEQALKHKQKFAKIK